MVEDGYCELGSLIINTNFIPVDVANKFLKPNENNRKISFYMPLNEYIQVNQNGDKFVELERSYKIKQNLISEPFF